MLQNNSFKISHFISTAGLMSRRAAERVVRSGRVAINGSVNISCAIRVTADDRITLDGQVIKPDVPKLFAFYKPTGYLVSHVSQNGKPTIFELIKLPCHLIFVGRLDYMSEGLLLLTNSPAIAHKLTQPGIPRRYQVIVNIINPLFRKFLQNPILNGIRLRAIDLMACLPKQDGFMVELQLYEGKNREIRRICQVMKMRVLKLKRTKYADVECKNLRPGQVMEISLNTIS